MTAGAPAVAVVGGGPAGLMAAEVLAAGGAAVTVYDRMPTVGRKLLMAGRGGLNLTHSEPPAAFLARYRTDGAQVRAAIDRFSPDDLRAWCTGLGQETFVGSSGRVFPRAMKASPLLRAWLRRLAGQRVTFAPRHRWVGWNAEGALRFEMPAGPLEVTPAATVLALGGASWPNLGSDGSWVAFVPADQVAVLRPANCGVAVAWSPVFRERFEGAPLKNVALRFGARSARGDVVVTRDGLEGGAVYALAADFRDPLAAGPVTVTIDLRPDMTPAAVAARLGPRDSRQSLAAALKKRLNLAPVAIGLLHEAALSGGQPLTGWTPERLVALIGAVPVRLSGTAGLARAISTAGGLRFPALDKHLMLRDRPGTFAASEMLDWEAPTGGYLLQACFATGVAAGEGVLRWLDAAGVTGSPRRVDHDPDEPTMPPSTRRDVTQQVRAHAGYEEDFHAWADEQAGLLRGREVAQADLDNIAEELEGLSRSERRALLSSLRLIVLHLLKLRHQPERATASWHTTIHRERMNVEDALADMPSLRSHLPALFEKAYRDGRRLAIVETGLAAELFPEAHEFTYDQVSDAGYLPEAGDADDMPIAGQKANPTGSRLVLARLKRSDQT